MDDEVSRTTPRRRLTTAVAVSLGAHLLLALAIGLSWKLPIVRDARPGETLMVELQNPESPAPLGNPSARQAAPSGPPQKVTAPRASRPQRASPESASRASGKPAAVAARPSPAKSGTETAQTRPAPQQAAPAPDDKGEAPVPKAAEPVARPTETVHETPRTEPDQRATPLEHRVAAPPPDARESGASGGRPTPDIRAALRSGGGGPPGGRIGGRGGIDGDPIRLDSTDPRYNDYLERLRRMIQDKMGFYPCIKHTDTRECEYQSAELFIEFGILKSGELQFVDLRASSGLSVYDDNSTNAIKLAAPFPAPPAAMLAAMKAGSTGVAIVARFRYIYEVSFKTLLQ